MRDTMTNLRNRLARHNPITVYIAGTMLVCIVTAGAVIGAIDNPLRDAIAALPGLILASVTA